MDTKTGLDITGAGDVAIASFTSTCISDVEQITNASAQLRDFIETYQPRRVVFDFSNVKFFSSQVLGLLLETRARVEPHCGEVAIMSLSPQLLRVFKITNLDGIFHFYADRATAIGSISNARN